MAASSASAADSFVGYEVCASCHQAEAERWLGSDHDLAMQEAAQGNVLGDFNNASITHYGVTSTFSRRGDNYFVETDGPDGKLQEYEIAYTFGVYPAGTEIPSGQHDALYGSSAA